MSSDTMVRVDGVSKCFRVYASPGDRLRQCGQRWIARHLPASAARLLSRHRPDREDQHLFWALKDVSFELKRGESVGILGMNGAGKSTLLQIVAGILKPTTGHVDTRGRLAGLFELGSGFNPEFTGRENVFLNAAMLGFRRAEVIERFGEIERFAGIGDFLDRPVKTYSSGMMVRLAFAVQVQLNTDILVVDEALAVGDALFQKRCYERIERFLADGGSLLFVSHDQESVRTLTDRALLLKDGRTVCMGTSSEVVLAYRRLIHEAENQQAHDVLHYLSSCASRHVRQHEAVAPAATAASEPAGANAAVGATSSTATGSAETLARPSRIRSADMSFGDLDVEVLSTNIYDSNGGFRNLFYPGDTIDICVRYRAKRRIKGLNLGIRLRNKEGVKVYSGGTFNADLFPMRPTGTERIWDREFERGDVIELHQRFECRLGEGYYEVQSYVAEEKVLAPGYQRMLHWVDESAFFRVSMNKFERWYGGVCDIRPDLAVTVRPVCEPRTEAERGA